MRSQTAPARMVGEPLIVVPGTDPRCWQEARLGACGHWLTAVGEPVAKDRAVRVNRTGLTYRQATAITDALEALGYRDVAVVQSILRRGTASYGYRGAYRVE